MFSFQIVPASKPHLNTPSYLNNTPDPIKPNPISELSKRFANKPTPNDISPPSNTSTPPISPMKPSVRKHTPTPVTKPSMAPAAPPPNHLEDQVWYKQDFDRKASENFLRSYCVDGGFVVRPSTQEGPGKLLVLHLLPGRDTSSQDTQEDAQQVFSGRGEGQ